MEDSEQCSSEEQDSVATEPSEDSVIATLSLDRMLTTEASWICLGKNKNGSYELFIPEDDWPNPDELTGFIYRVCNPNFILSAIANQGKE